MGADEIEWGIPGSWMEESDGLLPDKKEEKSSRIGPTVGNGFFNKSVS